MLDSSKKIDSKYLVPIFLFLILGLPIVFGFFGSNGFFILIFFAMLIFRKKFSKSFNLANFLTNLANKNNMASQMPNAGDYSQQLGGVWRGIKVIILILVAIWVVSWFVVIVGAGETGVVSLFGKVRDSELRSGFHMVNPLVKIEKMSIRTEQYTMNISPTEGKANGNDSISALTKEGLDVDIDFTALYRLDEGKASDIYREVGLDYVSKIIRPEIRGVIRDVVSQYEAKELYSEKRQEASNRIATLLRERVEFRGIIIEEAVIRNVQLPASLTKAIQEKLASEQEAQRYDFVLEKETKEAERKRIEAAGQRDSQKIINESLSNEYLNYLYIKELKDRQGTIYVPIDPASGMPMFKGIGQ